MLKRGVLRIPLDIIFCSIARYIVVVVIITIIFLKLKANQRLKTIPLVAIIIVSAYRYIAITNMPIIAVFVEYLLQFLIDLNQTYRHSSRDVVVSVSTSRSRDRLETC